MKSLPVVCELSSEALAQRKATTLTELFSEVQELQPLRSGYRFRFEVSDQLLTNIVEMINKERKCCRFMDFELQIAAAEGPVWLAVSGPAGTRDFLESLLNVKP
ncbi:MAG: hypothetical protein AAF564_20060 [Bacteroidota bacterium]